MIFGIVISNLRNGIQWLHYHALHAIQIYNLSRDMHRLPRPRTGLITALKRLLANN